nr:zinc finger, CCHC-type [Tanacetum cinerariifolium]
MDLTLTRMEAGTEDQLAANAIAEFIVAKAANYVSGGLGSFGGGEEGGGNANGEESEDDLLGNDVGSGGGHGGGRGGGRGKLKRHPEGLKHHIEVMISNESVQHQFHVPPLATYDSVELLSPHQVGKCHFSFLICVISIPTRPPSESTKLDSRRRKQVGAGVNGCDVHSHGAVLWELCTMQEPMGGINAMQDFGALGFQHRLLEIPNKDERLGYATVAKWKNDDYICRCILNGMSDSLFDVYTNVELAKELWDSLESKTYEPMEDGSVLYMGDVHFTPVHEKGSVVLEFSSEKSITLFNVLYVPKLRIIHETIAPYTPQQNVVAKRKNRALKKMVNSMLSYSGLSEGFWGEAMLIGDPLAPFLFILVMESLHLSFSCAIAAGMSINIHKSHLLGIGVSDVSVFEAANRIGCSVMKASFR